MKRKLINFNLFRLLSQLSILGILFVLAYDFFIQMKYVDFEAYCPFGGIMALGSFIENESLTCSMTSKQIGMGIILFVSIILFSKLFCSNICPIGTVTEFISKQARKLKVNFTPKGITDKALRIIKYVLLAIIFYFTLETSELFCKKFDPYYAIATGFNDDVNLWMAIISIATVFIGSFFVRMFWCKYACPLGALSNIFKNYWSFIVLAFIYIILLWTGVKLSLFWFVLAISIVGYIQEILNNPIEKLQLIKIVRDEEICIDCKKCNKSCPQGIAVTEYTKVNHIDCNMCGECVSVCHVKGSIGVNQPKKKLVWLPTLIVAILLVIGLFLGKQFELPTVNIFWGDGLEKEYSETFTMDNLRDVKCYGSSMSFVEQMKQVPGVIGAATYVDRHRVKVLYDPQRIEPAEIKEAIFNPAKMLNIEPDLNLDSLVIVSVEVNNFFDGFDTYFMNILLSQYSEHTVFGYESMYGEPVNLKLFMDQSPLILNNLKDFIEKDEIAFIEEGIEYTEDLNFEVVSIDVLKEKISRIDFMLKMFKAYNATCNNYENYEQKDIETFKVKVLGYRKNQQMGAHLRNDIARNDTGIVRVKTYYAGDYPIAEIEYVNTITNPENIWNSISKDTLTVTYTNGYVQKLKNPFQFEKIRSEELLIKPEKQH